MAHSGRRAALLVALCIALATAGAQPGPFGPGGGGPGGGGPGGGGPGDFPSVNHHCADCSALRPMPMLS